MAEPLDYRNPKHANSQAEPRSLPRPPQAAVPADFDHLLTATEDHAAARAIEIELHRQAIEVFRSEPNQRVGRVTRLYVRPADREQACQVAARIFARRQRIRSFPRPDLPPNMPNTPDFFSF